MGIASPVLYFRSNIGKLKTGITLITRTADVCIQWRHHRDIRDTTPVLHYHTTQTMSARFFEEKDHAALYSNYRPTYPTSLYQSIVNFCDQSKGSENCRDLAVDVGCGNGLSTRPLSAFFRKVTGSDVSKEQIATAKQDLENVTYHVGPGEDLSYLSAGSTNLITVAQALHWFDRPVFYKEVARVLKPGGVLAAYGYGNHTIDNSEANILQEEFYSQTLSGYWDSRRDHIDDVYTSIEPPFTAWHRDDSLTIVREWTIDSYVGYLSTWSGWRAYQKAFPETDALAVLKQRISQIYGRTDGSLVEVTWPVFILMEHK